MKQGQLRIVCPSGHLGYLPCSESLFRRASRVEPDYYYWNSGSRNPDPFLVGVDCSLSLYDWQKHDLELALLSARRQHVPLLISTASDTGTNSRVDLYVECLRHLSQKHNLSPFTLAYFYTEVSKQTISRYSEHALPFSEQDGSGVITEQQIEQTDRILAIAGGQPYLRALHSGADVIIGGRSCQTSVAAALALHHHVPAGLAYSLGYALERYGHSNPTGEALLGQITDDTVSIRVLNPQEDHGNTAIADQILSCSTPPLQRQTPDGMLDLSGCRMHRIDKTTVQVGGAVFSRTENPAHVLLEGAGKVGERHLGILRVSDAAGREPIQRLCEWAFTHIADHFTGKPYQLTYQTYEHHPLSGSSAPHAQANGAWFLVVEGIAETGQIAEELTVMATRMLLAAMPDNAFLTLESVLPAPPVYRWTILHTLPMAIPNNLFALHVVTMG